VASSGFVAEFRPDTGAVIDRLDVPFDYSTTRGVAARPGEIWVSSQANDQLVVLDPEGNHIGLVDGAPLDDDWTYAWDLHIDFSGDDLVLVSDSHVTTFSISTR
jgi:DNA-binding beta-propeller fold protein YncE